VANGHRLPATRAFTLVPFRVQVSLFAPPHGGADLEAIREIVDPVQRRLIPVHVTLCREDELGAIGLDVLQQRLCHASGPLTLHFGPPMRFGEHGILMMCVGGTDDFHALREVVLADRHARPHAPHLTLAHPRNPKALGNDLGATAALRAGLTLTFEAVHLIEQVDGDPWVVRGTVSLQRHASVPTGADRRQPLTPP
jgi:2'-5' RNA ligase